MTEVRTISSTGGRKGQKIERYGLIPTGPLRELARHYGVGAEKYTERDTEGNVTHDGAGNWRLGYDWSLSFDSLMRHAQLFWSGEDRDEETGSKHIIAVAWHALALAEFMETHREFDNRHKREDVSVGSVGPRTWENLSSGIRDWADEDVQVIADRNGNLWYWDSSLRDAVAEEAARRGVEYFSHSWTAIPSGVGPYTEVIL